MNSPAGVVSDTAGNLYIADSENNAIRKVNAATGEITTIAGNGTALYGGDGFIPQNDRKVYSFNNVTAKKDADGSVTIQFGGSADKAANCIPIVAGWNYMVRLYRPRPELLNGVWKFPDATPIS